MIEKCRLCSSSTGLITLTSGKCRQHRNYIRKLIAETTGIEFKKHDVLNLICFTCTAQIYNFYLFRVRSLQNERKLQEITRDHEIIPKNSKRLIADVCDIELPDLEELQTTVSPWIQSKLKLLECDEYENSCSSESGDTDSSKRQDSVQSSDVSTQTKVSSAVLIDREVQVDPVSTWNVSVQTFVKTVDEKIQCCLRTGTTDKGTQHVVCETKEESVQCNLEHFSSLMKIETCSDINCLKNVLPVIADMECGGGEDAVEKIPPCRINDELMEERKLTETVDLTENALEGVDKNDTVLTALGLASRHSTNQKKLVDSSPTRDTRQARIKQSLSPNNSRRIDSKETVITIEENTTEKETFPVEVNNVGDRREKDRDVQVLEKQACDKITENNENTQKIGNISEVLREISKQTTVEILRLEETSSSETEINEGLGSEPLHSLQTPKKKSVHSDQQEHTKDSPQPQCFKYDSPRSSNLLSVKNKVQYVRICRECDHTMYSKNELLVHRKTHMRCPVCKKKFRSIVRAKMHFSLECDKKMSSMVAVVPLKKIAVPQDCLVTCPNLKSIENNHVNKRKKCNSPMSPVKKFKG